MGTFFIDALGDMCPIPALRAEQKLKKLKKGDVLVIETDHSCAMTSIPNHLKKKCSVEIKEVEEGIWQIIMTKKN
ncbi:sulfurtransferase TusA family protein [Candidatus Contubernalis alkaliaceticus]|uniref:sulfurtransferase TusA family protein n=1 Tax=Candidatus Contubernalis alkaliaceticus TaxID=338645 RepID=UPI001F4BE27D|nr:sulfurtransferase TusA family protein [Candidatus Contubernalis alkalaceticus]UNC92777.1 sulfurtransferase TusA family protein [Candidatus Contubernalis alkalaceticus]